MIDWLVHKRSVVYLATLCIVIFGTITYLDLPREASPDVNIPVVMVTTPYIGVSPQDIESLVTVPLENELAGLKDLKKMSSTSAEGISIISLEFEPSVVIEDAMQQARDRANRARSKLPDDAEDTDIREVSFSDVPIMIITIAGKGIDEEALKKLGEPLEDEIRRVPGVLEAELTGGREREIKVQVLPHRLEHYKLSLNDVIRAISQENVNIPGGDVTTGDANYLLRVPGEFEDPAAIENVAIKRIGDRPVFVRDVARVIDGWATRTSYARMNQETAVSIRVTKRSGANILQIADDVKALVAKQAERWPKRVSYRVLGDQSKMIKDMVSDLENGIGTALVLVVAVILFFMGARNSLFVAISIPLSMLLSMMFISLFGMTLNMMVLFSLILALGMLVDNAIVLVENIYRHVEEGMSLLEASIEGTKEVAGAVAASTATTVAAFFPLVFWTGIMGEFMGFMPKTVVTVLLCSLVVAVCILPVITSQLMKRSKQSTERVKGEDGQPVSPIQKSKVMSVYQSILEWSIHHRYKSALLGFAALIGTFVAYGALNHGVEFFSETDPNFAIISVRAPDGTDLEATDRIVHEIEAIVSTEPNVDVMVAETGVSGGTDPLAGSQNASNMARISVYYLPDQNSAKPDETVRVESTLVTTDRIRKRLESIVGAKITVDKENMGPPVGAPVAVEVSGEDFHAVGALAKKVSRSLEDAAASGEIPGLIDLSDNYRVGRPEMRLRIDRGAAKRVGASTQAVASTVRTAVAGSVASTFRDGEDEYDIVVEVAPEYRDDLQSVLGMRIPGSELTSPDTFPVPISTVASYDIAGGSGSIRHIDQDLVVTISGDVAEGQNQNLVQQLVKNHIENMDVAPMHLRLGGANDEQKEAEKFLSRAFLIAIFLIGMVLVTQFNRFDIPLIILASVLLSLIGVLWGLIITGTAFGVIMTGLGVISLAGIVVNNAIVLLDYVGVLRKKGMPVFEALVQAGLTRFRPVLLTALTTVLGLIPMAVGVSFDFRKFRFLVGGQTAQWWSPMAVAVIFGLVVATVLTLVMVPTFYSILEDIRKIPSKIKSRFFGGKASAISAAGK